MEPDAESGLESESSSALQEAQQQYDQESQKDRLAVDEELRTRLRMLATDFPRLWRDPNTPERERKRLARVLLEDVTLIKRDQILVHVRFPGGATRTLELPIPTNHTQIRCFGDRPIT